MDQKSIFNLMRYKYVKYKTTNTNITSTATPWNGEI